MAHVVVKAKDHRRDRSLGWLAVSWIEAFCLHGPGDIQGRPLSYRKPDAIPLSDELSMLTVDVYALDDETGHRLYDSAFFSRPKGANKSGYAAWLGLFEALGPCRFAGWAEGGEVFEWLGFRHIYEPGEPMGRRVTYPFLRILATEEGQTGNVYDSMYVNLKEGPLNDAFPRKDDIGLTRVFLPGGGEIRPSTASSSAKDGGKETWANFDETHIYVLPELRRMYDTVRRNMTKRKDSEPWSFETSTMYQPGQDSIAERSHKLAMLIKEGGKVRYSRLFFDHREAHPDTDVRDEASLRKGLSEAYGDSWPWQDQERKVSEIMDLRNDVTDSRRYSLNQVTAAFDAWITPQEWDALAKPEHEVPTGAMITLGLDPSDSDDHTVLMGCEVATGHFFPLGVWNPADYPEHLDDGSLVHRLPKPAVDKAVRDAFATYDVVGFYSDVHPAEDYIDRWTEEFGEQLCSRVSQLQPIKFYMGGPGADARVTTHAVEAYHTAIISGVDISHSGDERINQYHYNCRRRPNRHGVTFGKGLQTEKIDGAPSAMLARKARQDYMALSPEKKRKQVGMSFLYIPGEGA